MPTGPCLVSRAHGDSAIASRRKKKLPASIAPGSHARRQIVERFRRAILRRTSPRAEMALMLALAGLAGLVASVLLRVAGVGSMAVRYPIAMLAAYGTFLLLVRGWARRYVRGLQRWRPDPLDLVDVPDLVADLPSLASRGVGEVVGSSPLGGGAFGGGGAGGVFDAPAIVASAGDGVTSAVGGAARAAGKGATSAAGDALASSDDAWPVALVVLVFVAGVFAVVLGIWMAPTLLAEALVDTMIVAGTVRGLREVEATSWATHLVRRTWMPAAALLVLLGVAGWVMQRTVPGAESIGQFFAEVGRSYTAVDGPALRALGVSRALPTGAPP